MRLPRMTTRTWMIAAAAIVLLAADGFVSWRQRNYLSLSQRYQKPVIEFAATEQQFLTLIQSIERSNVSLRSDVAAARSRWESETDADERKTLKAQMEQTARLIEANERTLHEAEKGIAKHSAIRMHYQALVAKYASAARRPWLPVPPDPPPPE